VAKARHGDDRLGDGQGDMSFEDTYARAQINAQLLRMSRRTWADQRRSCVTVVFTTPLNLSVLGALLPPGLCCFSHRSYVRPSGYSARAIASTAIMSSACCSHIEWGPDHPMSGLPKDWALPHTSTAPSRSQSPKSQRTT
jgi:hypothetical protein